jgi:hypothetical protein
MKCRGSSVPTERRAATTWMIHRWANFRKRQRKRAEGGKKEVSWMVRNGVPISTSQKGEKNSNVVGKITAEREKETRKRGIL